MWLLQGANAPDHNTLAIFRTKIEANANKYNFVWKKAPDKFENNLQDKIKKEGELLSD